MDNPLVVSRGTIVKPPMCFTYQGETKETVCDPAWLVVELDGEGKPMIDTAKLLPLGEAFTATANTWVIIAGC